MIVSIHQPQYLPWLPYYSKIARSEIFVFLDDAQYQKNGLHNRNEIKNSNGRFWLTVPVSAHLGDKINEVKLINNGWQKKHVKSIHLNYSKSLNYHFFSDYIKTILEQNIFNLVELNIKLIEIICQNYFKIKTNKIRQTSLCTTDTGSDLILDICKKLEATTYLSGPGGKNYLNEKKFVENGIKIDYINNQLPEKYPQMYRKVGFINDLSALDLILNVESEWTQYYNL